MVLRVCFMAYFLAKIAISQYSTSRTRSSLASSSSRLSGQRFLNPSDRPRVGTCARFLRRSESLFLDALSNRPCRPAAAAVQHHHVGGGDGGGGRSG